MSVIGIYKLKPQLNTPIRPMIQVEIVWFGIVCKQAFHLGELFHRAACVALPLALVFSHGSLLASSKLESLLAGKIWDEVKFIEFIEPHGILL